MAKVRKSKEQKIKAELRHFDYHYELPTSHIISQTANSKENPAQVSLPQTVAYPYLKNDLLRTLMVTGVILGFQLITFILLKKTSFSIPGIG